MPRSTPVPAQGSTRVLTEHHIRIGPYHTRAIASYRFRWRLRHIRLKFYDNFRHIRRNKYIIIRHICLKHAAGGQGQARTHARWHEPLVDLWKGAVRGGTARCQGGAGGHPRVDGRTTRHQHHRTAAGGEDHPHAPVRRAPHRGQGGAGQQGPLRGHGPPLPPLRSRTAPRGHPRRVRVDRPGGQGRGQSGARMDIPRRGLHHARLGAGAQGVGGHAHQRPVRSLGLVHHDPDEGSVEGHDREGGHQAPGGPRFPGHRPAVGQRGTGRGDRTGPGRTGLGSGAPSRRPTPSSTGSRHASSRC